MSTTASKLFKKPIHHRTNSNELGVFEASKYFSAYNEDHPSHLTSAKTRVLPSRVSSGSAGRMSLDLPTSSTGIEPFDHHHTMIRSQILKAEKGHIGNNSSSNSAKQHKQPSSPGGRVASFLNTLFHQASKKNKKKKAKANEEDHESPGGSGMMRRKRRSSISHFTRSITDTRSWYSSNHVPVLVPASSTSTIACTPTKSGYKNLRSLIAASDQNQKLGGVEKGSCCCKDSWLDEKSVNPDGIRIGDCGGGGNGEDGCESDSSSDLFELQIFDLDAYSNGLPVYETTDVGSIARGVGGSKSISSSCGTI